MENEKASEKFHHVKSMLDAHIKRLSKLSERDFDLSEDEIDWDSVVTICEIFEHVRDANAASLKL